MEGVIYCFYCISTGKKYIGQTVNLNRRIISHRKDCRNGLDNKFYRAVKKYGWDNFIFGIVAECEREDLNEKEIFFINNYDTYNNGYNSTLGGGGRFGFVLSEDTKNKISLANRGNKMSEEQKKYLSDLNKNRNVIPPNRKGCKMSESAKLKISEASKNRKFSESTRRKLSESHGKEFTLISPEGNIVTGKNISEFCKNNNLNRTCIYNVLNSKALQHKGWKRL
jgi:group I intron endonuclease